MKRKILRGLVQRAKGYSAKFKKTEKKLNREGEIFGTTKITARNVPPLDRARASRRRGREGVVAREYYEKASRKRYKKALKAKDEPKEIKKRKMIQSHARKTDKILDKGVTNKGFFKPSYERKFIKETQKANYRFKK